MVLEGYAVQRTEEVQAQMRRVIESRGLAISMALVATIALAAFLTRAEMPGAGPASYRWMTYSNTALAGSALLYSLYLWLHVEAVGRAATALAAGGALGVLVSLASGALRSGGAGFGLYESTALLCAGAVLAYLALERTYGTRSAGAVVMLAVMAAVFCEIWLIAQGLAAAGGPPAGLGSYWEAGHRFAISLGYCPIAAASVLAALSVPDRLPEATPPPGGAALAALSVSAPLLLLGAGMGAIWSVTDRSASPNAAGHAIVCALLATLALVAWLRARDPADPRIAQHAIGLFVTATAWLLVSGGSSAGFG